MDLCHEKHAEFNRPPEEKVYKGRVVFRGDQVKDETGYYAVFSEQSASASHMAAVKFMDYIGRVPGNALEDSDAIKAYTQVKLSTVQNLLGQGVQPETCKLCSTWVVQPAEKKANGQHGQHGNGVLGPGRSALARLGYHSRALDSSFALARPR